MKSFSLYFTNYGKRLIRLQPPIWKCANKEAVRCWYSQRKMHYYFLLSKIIRSVLIDTISIKKLLVCNFFRIYSPTSSTLINLYIFSGLEILDDSRIFVILTDHQTYNISIKNEKCVCVPIPFKINPSFKKYVIRGVSFSRNQVFCAVTMG